MSRNYPLYNYQYVFQMTALEEYNDEVQKPKIFFPKRYFMTLMLFMGMANAYIMRTNMSVAIVAMVNQTFARGDSEIDVTECVNQPTIQEVINDGEFNWTSEKQGYILSSFFVGYVITQVGFLFLIFEFSIATTFSENYLRSRPKPHQIFQNFMKA